MFSFHVTLFQSYLEPDEAFLRDFLEALDNVVHSNHMTSLFPTMCIRMLLVVFKLLSSTIPFRKSGVMFYYINSASTALRIFYKV